MPKGQHRKPSDNANFLKINKDFKYTSLQSGLRETIEWFEKKLSRNKRYKMISCNIMGRLGNQMFQMATSESLAIDRNEETIYTTSILGARPTS